MDYGVYRYDEPYGYRQPRRRVNYFGWTVAILLLSGITLAAWLLSFYIFGQPERPESYHVLQKLHKIDPPKRFELTAAPKGEFLDVKTLVDRYSAMGSAELAKANAELARNYIRNFQQVRGLVPYVVGRFAIMEARELGPYDLFTSGMVALTSAVEHGELLMEHVYPADAQAVPLMKQTLTPGLEIRLERTHDLSAIIHVDRLGDGRIMITTVPLLYGTYTVTKGTGTFTLEPPLDLNLRAGWPLYKEQPRLRAELHFAEARREATNTVGPPPVTGLEPTGTPPPAQNELVRVEQAKPVEPVVAQSTGKSSKLTKATPPPKKGKLAKGQKPTPAPSVAPAQSPAIAVAQPSPAAPAITPAPSVAKSPPTVAAATAAPAPSVAQALAVATPATNAPPAPPNETSNALASTAGGGTWKTFPAGKMPLGRLIAPNDLKDLAEHGVAGERIYLKGQFVVNAADANHAVLRPRTRLATAMLHLGGSNTRIVVEFPAGYAPPTQGSVVTRDDARPLEITEVRKDEDGQLNVFAREIMQ
ncbi:MAG: hypothetical protein QOG48_859 [Verrucomicrobiota bacterium]|jgi:hypothetical protein